MILILKNRRDCNKQKLQEDYGVIQVKVSTESYEQRHSREKEGTQAEKYGHIALNGEEWRCNQNQNLDTRLRSTGRTSLAASG